MNITIENGTVSKDGEQIGHIDGERCVLSKRPAPQVYAAINKAHGSKLAFDIEPENKPTRTNPPAEDRVEVEAEVATVAIKIQEPIHLQTAAMGDKTPAFVQWCRENLPAAEFERRYAHRRVPESMTAFEIAERKRHGKLPNEKEDSGN